MGVVKEEMGLGGEVVILVVNWDKVGEEGERLGLVLRH